jgi:signal transduction histidine kinase
VGLNAVGLFLFALVQGFGLAHSFFEGGIVAIAGAAAWVTRRNHLVASVFGTLGLLTASAVLVHLAEGSIEAHFHFFVMVTLIILYQDWVPFLLSIAYVVSHHAFFGLVSPETVFNHPAAVAQPVKWALIHGGFILGATIAGLTVWKQNERLRSSYQEAASRLAEAQTRQRDALDLNDNVLQHLVIANQAFELGLTDMGTTALKDSLKETQKLVSASLRSSMAEIQPGDLVRKQAAAAAQVAS